MAPTKVDGNTNPSEQFRFEQYKNRIKHQNEMELGEISEDHKKEVMDLVDRQDFQLNNLRQDFDVRISQEAEDMEARINRIRGESEQRVADEVRQADERIGQLKEIRGKEY